MTKHRALIVSPYIRVSALMGREGEKFISPDMQLEEVTQYVKSLGYMVGPVFQDIGKSGRTFDRPGIQEAFAAKRAGKIDGLAVYDVSRLGRTSSKTVDAMESFEKDGGVFVSVLEKFNDTPEGILLRNLFCGMAQMQSDRMAVGWRNAITHRAKQGMHPSPAHPPVGYRVTRDPAGRITGYEVDEDIAPFLREAFRRFAGGESGRQVGLYLVQHGVLSASTAAKRTLSNPFYVGKVRLYEYTGRGKARKLAPSPPSITDGRHPALLVTENGTPDIELFDRVQAKIAADTRMPRRALDPSNPLVGIARCAGCQRSLAHQRANNGRTNRFRCTNEHCEGIGTPDAQPIIDHVKERARDFVWNVSVDTCNAARDAAEAIGAERLALARVVEGLHDAITRSDTDYYRGLLDRDRHDRATRSLTAQLHAAEKALAAVPAVIVPDRAQLEQAGRRLDEEWETASHAVRAAMLRDCGVARVEVSRAQRSGWRPPVEDRVRVVIAVPGAPVTQGVADVTPVR